MELSDKYGFKITVINEDQIRAILHTVINEYIANNQKIKHINEDIAFNYIVVSKHMDVTDNFRRILNAIERRYTEYKRNNDIYDFNDYPLYLYNILRAYNENITNVDALFVDEFQDVDAVQLQVLDMVAARKKFYIGDQKQSIYGFRGCDGKSFDRLVNFKMFDLDRNYRSYQEIIDYASTVYAGLIEKATLEKDCFITEILYSRGAKIVCARGFGAQMYAVNPYGRVFMQGQCTLGTKLDAIFRNFMNMKPMVLCRTNKQVRETIESGYPYAETVHQAKGLEYRNVIVIDNTINSVEDLNIAYVAMTRAEDNLLVINWPQFYSLLNKYSKNLQ